MMAVMKTGKKHTIVQSFAMPAPYTNAARNNRPSRPSSRYSSNDQITNANSSKPTMSPVKFVAFSQNVSCKPHSNTAKTGGNQAVGMVKNEKAFCSRVR